MTLLQLWNLLLRLLGVSQTIEALTLGISSAIAGWTKTFNSIVQPITDIHHAVTDSGHGNAAIAAAISTFTNVNTKTIADILDAIAALPAGSDIVVPAASDNAAAVWLYQGSYRDRMGNMLGKLDETNFKLGPKAGYLAPATPWFGLYNPTSFTD
jgi:hypothetical protein